MLDFFPPENYEFPDEKYKIEKWEYLDNTDVPNIIPNRYMISTWGRILDIEANKYYPTDNITKQDYTTVVIHLLDGSYKQFRIHPLMVHKFKGISNEGSDIDHIDGNRSHNWIWNLERVTHQENLKRAVNIGLYKTAENHQNSIYTNEQIRLICDLISRGYTQKQIIIELSEKVPGLKDSTIYDIKNRLSWTDISKDYDFSNAYRKEHVSNPMDIDMVEKICQTMELYGIKTKPKDIMKYIGIDLDELTDIEKRRYENCIHKLRRRIVFKEICNKYNY